MAYHIKLIRGLSYTGFGGKVKATRKNPVATVEDKAIANAAVASGFFKLIEEADEARVLTGHLDATQLEGMDTKDLKALAIQMGIDVKGMRSKKDFIAAITTAEVADKPPFDAAALAAMSDEELAVFVNEHNIDLTGCQTREDGLAAICAAMGGSYTMLDLMQE